MGERARERRTDNGGRDAPAAVIVRHKPPFIVWLRHLLRFYPTVFLSFSVSHQQRFYPVVHATPLTVKAVGEALLPVQVPWNPNDVEPPEETVPL